MTTQNNAVTIDVAHILLDEQSALNYLRDRGNLVVVFTPEELQNACRETVEDRMTAAGWDAIAQTQEDFDA